MEDCHGLWWGGREPCAWERGREGIGRERERERDKRKQCVCVRKRDWFRCIHVRTYFADDIIFERLKS